MIGDSQMRMFFSRLVERVNGTLSDRRFGSYLIHDKGGCFQSAGESEGHKSNECTREYIKHDIRLTFGFQAFGQHKNVLFESLVSESTIPDLVLLSTGAWDIGYKGSKISVAANHSLQMIHNVREVYAGPIVWCLTNVCDPFKNSSSYLNEAQLKALSAVADKDLVLLNREPSTLPLTDAHLCEGYHAYGNVVSLHVDMLLNALC